MISTLGCRRDSGTLGVRRESRNKLPSWLPGSSRTSHLRVPGSPQPRAPGKPHPVLFRSGQHLYVGVPWESFCSVGGSTGRVGIWFGSTPGPLSGYRREDQKKHPQTRLTAFLGKRKPPKLLGASRSKTWFTAFGPEVLRPLVEPQEKGGEQRGVAWGMPRVKWASPRIVVPFFPRSSLKGPI